MITNIIINDQVYPSTSCDSFPVSLRSHGVCVNIFPSIWWVYCTLAIILSFNWTTRSTIRVCQVFHSLNDVSFRNEQFFSRMTRLTRHYHDIIMTTLMNLLLDRIMVHEFELWRYPFKSLTTSKVKRSYGWKIEKLIRFMRRYDDICPIVFR